MGWTSYMEYFGDTRRGRARVCGGVLVSAVLLTVCLLASCACESASVGRPGSPGQSASAEQSTATDQSTPTDQSSSADQPTPTDQSSSADQAISSSNSSEEASSRAVQPAGDGALPALNGDYEYVIAKVLAKDADTQTLEVEVSSAPVEGVFNRSALSEGEIGTVLCDELVLYPAGINIGTIVAIACVSDDAEAFPVTAFAIEKLEWFEDRVQRQQS